MGPELGRRGTFTMPYTTPTQRRVGLRPPARLAKARVLYSAMTLAGPREEIRYRAAALVNAH